MCSLWDLSSRTRDQICATCSGRVESQPLDHQGSPQRGFFGNKHWQLHPRATTHGRHDLWQVSSTLICSCAKPRWVINPTYHIGGWELELALSRVSWFKEWPRGNEQRSSSNDKYQPRAPGFMKLLYFLSEARQLTFIGTSFPEIGRSRCLCIHLFFSQVCRDKNKISFQKGSTPSLFLVKSSKSKPENRRTQNNRVCKL